MTSLYLLLLLGSLSVPLLFSVFYIDFIKHWRNFAISTIMIAVVFLIWDVIFTHQGIWEFNANYCLGITIVKIPIEEWLFFFIIPFCSLFIHFSLVHVLPKLIISRKATRLIALVIIVLIGTVLIGNLSKAYTAVNFIFLLITLIVGVIFHLELLQRFFLSFLVILIPFFLVNGVLTGAMTATPIVSYNDLENLGVRLWTIPIEDIGYAFTMLFGNLMIFESLNRKQKH